MQYLLVAIGSALGGMARFWMGLVVAALTGPRYPWGTLLINVLGSFLIGLVAAAGMPTARFGLPVEARVFLMVGVCGGFTTFSSFSLQTFELLERGEPLAALGYTLGSVVLCVLGTWMGMALGRG